MYFGVNYPNCKVFDQRNLFFVIEYIGDMVGFYHIPTLPRHNLYKLARFVYDTISLGRILQLDLVSKANKYHSYEANECLSGHKNLSNDHH